MSILQDRILVGKFSHRKKGDPGGEGRYLRVLLRRDFPEGRRENFGRIMEKKER
jgi:hypothetical protein